MQDVIAAIVMLWAVFIIARTIGLVIKRSEAGNAAEAAGE